MLSYIPLFGLFLPVRVAQVSDMPLVHQSAIVLVGSIVASIAGVLAGQISDAVFARTHSRRPMLFAGLTTIGSSYLLFVGTVGLAGLMLAVVVLQIGINLALAGLNALFAQHVAPQEKAHLASMVNLGLPIANLGLALLGGATAEAMSLRLLAIGGLTLALFWPLLRWQTGDDAPVTDHQRRPAHSTYRVSPDGATWAAVFTARFFVQLSGALLLTFVQPYLTSTLPAAHDGSVTLRYMVMFAAILSLPIALGAARLAAARANPLSLMQAAALILAIAMAMFAAAPAPRVIVICYAGFMAALVSYLAIDTAVVAQWSSASPKVATRLGLMNLANTLPGILIPALLLSTGGNAAQSLSGAFALTAIGGVLAVGLLALSKTRISMSL